MGADFNIKPVGAPVAAPVIRPAPEAVRAAVPTLLPSDQTVTATGALLQPNVSAANYQQIESDRISRSVVIDKDAGTVVYISTDRATNQVVNQYPEESRLRARAYSRAMDVAKENAKQDDRRIETDRKI